jgi:hypothetical protein
MIESAEAADRFSGSQPSVGAARGAIPLTEDGKVFGAIGSCGDTGSQDARLHGGRGVRSIRVGKREFACALRRAHYAHRHPTASLVLLRAA